MAVAAMRARTAVVVQGTMVGAAGKEAASGAMGIMGVRPMVEEVALGQAAGEQRDAAEVWQRGGRGGSWRDTAAEVWQGCRACPFKRNTAMECYRTNRRGQ